MSAVRANKTHVLSYILVEPKYFKSAMNYKYNNILTCIIHLLFKIRKTEDSEDCVMDQHIKVNILIGTDGGTFPKTLVMYF